VNKKYNCLKLHHVGYLVKQPDDAWNHKYKIKIDLHEVGYRGMDWIDLAQDRER